MSIVSCVAAALDPEIFMTKPEPGYVTIIINSINHEFFAIKLIREAGPNFPYLPSD